MQHKNMPEKLSLERNDQKLKDDTKTTINSLFVTVPILYTITHKKMFAIFTEKKMNMMTTKVSRPDRKQCILNA